MSIHEVTVHCRQAFQDVRKRPMLYLGFSAITAVFLWTQDMVPIAGPLLSSLATTTLMARLIRPGKVRAQSLIGLGALFFPVNALWTVLFSLFRNAEAPATAGMISPLWALPILFFMALALETHALTVNRIVEHGRRLDPALKEAWLTMTRRWPTTFLVALALAIASAIALAFHGWGFVVVLPLGLASLRETSFLKS